MDDNSSRGKQMRAREQAGEQTIKRAGDVAVYRKPIRDRCLGLHEMPNHNGRPRVQKTTAAHEMPSNIGRPKFKMPQRQAKSPIKVTPFTGAML